METAFSCCPTSIPESVFVTSHLVKQRNMFVFTATSNNGTLTSEVRKHAMFVFLVIVVSNVSNAIEVDIHMDIIIHGLQILTKAIRVITLPTAAAQTQFNTVIKDS